MRKGPPIPMRAGLLFKGGLMKMARTKRRAWTAVDNRELKKHSKNKTPVKTISRTMKRTPNAVRQKAHLLGISIGHRR